MIPQKEDWISTGSGKREELQEVAQRIAALWPQRYKFRVVRGRRGDKLCSLELKHRAKDAEVFCED